ncbi:hypothetical protein ABIB62_004753 [Mucilaginibacter sp. UYP25]|uniref:DUF6443 domain-containing protein n=1 Tax=unclassified Mucilaginibacter TaxID=2617802 RepID=UPI0033959FEE
MNPRYKYALKHLVIAAMICCVQGLQGQSITDNYIQTRVPRQAIKTDARLNALTPNKDSVMHTVQYVDGLGRPMQTVTVKGNADGTTSINTKINFNSVACRLFYLIICLCQTNNLG